MFRKRHGVTHPDIPLTFGLAPLVDGQTDAAVPGVGTTDYVLPFGGWLVGLGVSLSAAVGAGALSFDAKIGSTQQEVNLALGTADTEASVALAKEAYRFEAGDKLSVTYTSGTLTTNPNASAVLLVVLDMR